jgi:hypothetical protein
VKERPLKTRRCLTQRGQTSKERSERRSYFVQAGTGT